MQERKGPHPQEGTDVRGGDGAEVTQLLCKLTAGSQIGGCWWLLGDGASTPGLVSPVLLSLSFRLRFSPDGTEPTFVEGWGRGGRKV